MKRMVTYIIAVMVVILIGTLTGCDMRTDEEKMRDEVEAQMEERAANIRQETLEKAKATIEEYDKIGWFTLDIFTAIPPDAIGVDLIGYIEIFDDEKEQKLAFLEEQYREEIALLDRSYELDIVTTQEELEEMSVATEEKFQDRKKAIEDGYDKIIIIINTALEQERILTEAEAAIIVKTKEEMRKDIIGHLEDYVTYHE